MDLDEPLLQDIAARTDGRYFRASSPAELLQISHALDQLQPATAPGMALRQDRALYPWPLAAALLLSLLMLAPLLTETLRQRPWRAR